MDHENVLTPIPTNKTKSSYPSYNISNHAPPSLSSPLWYYTTSQANANANATSESSLASVHGRGFKGEDIRGRGDEKCGMREEEEVRGDFYMGVLVKSGNCVVVVYYIGFGA